MISYFWSKSSDKIINYKVYNIQTIMQKSNFSNILNIIIIILAVLNFGLIKAEAHTFHCPFDKLYANIDRSHDPHQKPDELMYDNSHG